MQTYVKFLLPVALCSLLLFTADAIAGNLRSLPLNDGVEIQAEVYGHSETTRILWIGPSFGIHPRHAQAAALLADAGFEVWQVDLIDSLFLTRGAGSMREISPAVVSALIKRLTDNQHQLLIISSSYGSIPTLRGVQQWQAEQPERASVIGVILFSPYLYTRVPPVGQAPEFIPVNTSVPIYIFQGEKNGNRWHFPAMLQHLQQHTQVYSEIMKGVTSLFYEEDKAIATLNMLEALPDKIRQRVPLLSRHKYALSAPPVELGEKTNAGLDAHLSPYRGTTQAQPFSLENVDGKIYSRSDFRGKVTVINFWASWCPPCVEEIPSLNRLRQKMQGKKFELISINYAESKQRIKTFMEKVEVDFPVLIDPEGKLAGQWKVVAFPSTFVIGPDGKIRYGVNAAILWDSPEVINALEKLLSE